MKKIIRILPIIWILFGLLFIGYGRYGYHILLNASANSQKIKSTIEDAVVTQKSTKEKNEEAAKADTFDETTIRPVDANDYANAQLEAESLINQWGIGAIYIPSSTIETKILAGMSNENLIIAVGTYKATQKMGEGNYIVLAHNLVEGGGALHNLRKTELGSIIYATDFSKVYEYKVTVNKIEKETNGELLNEPNEGEHSKITLFRCEGSLNTPNRAVVQGEFIKSYSATKADKQVLSGLGLVSPNEATSTPSKFNTTEQKSSSVVSVFDSENYLQNQSEKPSEESEQGEHIYNLVEIGAIKTFQLIEEYAILLIFLYILVLICLFIVQVKSV